MEDADQHEAEHLADTIEDTLNTEIDAGLRKVLTETFTKIEDASKVFIENYPESPDIQKFNATGLKALFNRSINNVLADFGFRCQPSNLEDPILVQSRHELVPSGRHKPAPPSPFSNPYSPYSRAKLWGKEMEPPRAKSVHVIRVRSPLAPKSLFRSPGRGGNRTRRRRQRR